MLHIEKIKSYLENSLEVQRNLPSRCFKWSL